MHTAIQADRVGDHASLVPAGPFDLPHATDAARAVHDAETEVGDCPSVDVDLSHVEKIDGSGAVLLARLFDRLDGEGHLAHVMEGGNADAARLISLYRGKRTLTPPARPRARSALAALGESAAALPGMARDVFDFTGRCAAAVPKAIAAPSLVNWRSLPSLIQGMGADALIVTGAANLLVGLIIGFLGVSQLGRFGAITYVPELVVVAHFRELGALVTAIVVAGRSGAGLASELATMKVSEEIDALRSLGFDPVRWLVIPRCIALVIVVPLLVWVGDVLAIAGGLMATLVLTDMTPRAYLVATAQSITINHLAVGLIKSPVLALAIGLVACGEGLAASGGAAAVGARTTAAVVFAIFSVIVLNALFTFLFVLLGV